MEGLEESILRGFSFDAFKFLAMTIERPSRKLKAVLRNHGYAYAFTQGWFGDELWLHSDFPGGAQAAAARVMKSSTGFVRWMCGESTRALSSSGKIISADGYELVHKSRTR